MTVNPSQEEWDNTPNLWRKSSFSSDTANCVEVAWSKPTEARPDNWCDAVRVLSYRDGIYTVGDPFNPDGPRLEFNQGEIDAFVAAIKAKEFDRIGKH